jgi:hypothetical protein
MKTEVYSWRVSGELKRELEREARRRSATVSTILDLAARDWLAKSRAAVSEDDAQQRLHAAAATCVGVFAGRNPHRAEEARATIRTRLRRRDGR